MAMSTKFQEKNSSSSSSSSLDTVELKLCLGHQANEPCKPVSLHQRSASDSLVLFNKHNLDGPGSFHNSIIGAQGCLKLEPGHVDGKASGPNIEKLDDPILASHCETEPRKWCQGFDPNMDPKKIKRLVANRVSAQKSRLKKLEYIEKLKNDILTQQARVSMIAPQVAYYELQRTLLQEENNAMKERLEILEKEKAIKEAESRALKDERDMLALTYFLMQEGI